MCYLFTYGGLMNPEVFKATFSTLPESQEFQLNNWQRTWTATIAAQSFTITHPYVPEEAKQKKLLLNYLNILPKENHYTVGRLYKISEKDLSWFDEFEGIDQGNMKRIQILQNDHSLWAYTASKKLLENYKKIKKLSQPKISQNYYEAMLKSKDTLTINLHEEDELKNLPPFEFL